MLKTETKLFISILIATIFLNNNANAQNLRCSIRFIADTIDNVNYRNLKINILQNDSFSVGKLDENITVYKGVDLSVEFENKKITIPGLKKLKVYSDTVISISTKTLSTVVIMAKERIVKQTLSGFDYYPSRDSIFRNKSIFAAMQRLPFVHIANESLEYKQGDKEKILFEINGKERKGVGSNWNDIFLA